jgi:hypothetical protein
VMPTSGVLLAEDLADHGWRLTPDRLAAHITRHEPVTEGFGGEFQMSGPYQRPRHVRRIGRVLADTISAGNGRLIVNQPPQTGKSMLISRWTPSRSSATNSSSKSHQWPTPETSGKRQPGAGCAPPVSKAR